MKRHRILWLLFTLSVCASIERASAQVGALERELRRRLGEPAIVLRALRTAADFSRLPRSR